MVIPRRALAHGMTNARVLADHVDRAFDRQVDIACAAVAALINILQNVLQVMLGAPRITNDHRP